MTSTGRRSAGRQIAIALLLACAAAQASAQRGKEQPRVPRSARPPAGSLPPDSVTIKLVHSGLLVGEPEGCKANPAGGSDTFTGKLQVGGMSVNYEGEVDRSFAFQVCGTKPLTTGWDELTYCVMNVRGSQRVGLSIDIRENVEAPLWIGVTPVEGAGSVAVTGDCVANSSDPMSKGLTMNDVKNEKTGGTCGTNVLCGLGFAGVLPRSALTRGGIKAGRYEWLNEADQGSRGKWTLEIGAPKLKGPTRGPPTAIVVTPNPAELTPNATQQFTAVAMDAFGTIFPMTSEPKWSVRAGGGTINSAGLFTAGTAFGTFTNTVVATSDDISGTATVTVTAGENATSTVTPKRSSRN